MVPVRWLCLNEAIVLWVEASFSKGIKQWIRFPIFLNFLIMATNIGIISLIFVTFVWLNAENRYGNTKNSIAWKDFV